MEVRKLRVSVSLQGKETDVGELVADRGKIYFRYVPPFLKTGLNISPIRLPFTGEIIESPARPFEGLHGVFADSLPDGWGRLLLDRTLASRGILVEDITTLHRLSFVGKLGMGALHYVPAMEHPHDEALKLELDAIAREMNKVFEGQGSDVIEELYTLGGSSGGARPKILVGFNTRTGHIIRDRDELPKGFEHWLIKFPSSIDRPDVANIEYAYHLMAVAAGIEMSKCRLLEGKSGKMYFCTRRFDRTPEGKLHMHSAAGLMHDDFRLSQMDYGNIMDCGFRLEGAPAYEKILRIAAFNVFAHNRDDHSKNISFLMDQKGNWKLAPAYDLTFSNSSHGFQSTMVARESKNPGDEHLLKLAAAFRIKKATIILEQVKEAVSRWKSFAKKADVDKISMNLIDKRISTLINKK